MPVALDLLVLIYKILFTFSVADKKGFFFGYLNQLILKEIKFNIFSKNRTTIEKSK